MTNTGDILYGSDWVTASVTLGQQISIADAIIRQLKTYAPIFNGNVAGVASPDAFLTNEATDLGPSPCAYVMLASSATDEQLGGGGAYKQLETELYMIVIALDNSPNVRGQTATEFLPSIKWQLIGALCGEFLPDPNRNPRGMVYEGNYKILGINRGQLFVSWEFTVETWITDKDAVKLQGQKLNQINTTTVFNGYPLQGVIP